jgi:hypothetical protein
MSPNLCGPHLLDPQIVPARRKSRTHLWPAASETTVSAQRFPTTVACFFAMHDLVADEIKGLAERSLVLTLPKEPTDSDDSLLTQLKLKSAWRRD